MSKKSISRAASSSSESSEDEDEARKIREAIWTCDVNLNLFQTDKNGQPSCSIKNTVRKPVQWPLVQNNEQATLKSNRPQNINDEEQCEEHNVLNTTPEFRAYVAKQLSQMLDQELTDIFSDQAWHIPKAESQSAEKGIKLFSDSKTWCKVLESSNGAITKPASLSHICTAPSKAKKCKLSSSSESSDDEKIKACVFTVSDIHHENERLAIVEQSVKGNTASLNGNSIKLDHGENETKCQNGLNHSASEKSCHILYKKKKKKRLKKKRKKDRMLNNSTDKEH